MTTEERTAMRGLYRDCPQVLALLDDYERMEERYYELIYGVATKHPDETRHETALRYILRAETPDPNEAARASLSKAGE